MLLLDLIRFSFRQIRKRFLESLLIILGIGLGIAVISAVVGVVDSVAKEEYRRAHSLELRRINFNRLTLNEYSPENIELPFSIFLEVNSTV